MSAPISPLYIRVVNGNLRFVRGALMIGHYRSTSLTGTERTVDLMYGRTLGKSLRIGGYPHRPGDQELFRHPVSNPTPDGALRQPEIAIVVGLGQEGKLTVPDHVTTVRQGVITWIRETCTATTISPVPLTLTATLLGSGGAGVPVGQAAQAIAQGVRDANARLRKVGYLYYIKHLRIIEVYLDRAIEAWRALQVLEKSAPEGEFSLKKTIQPGIGAMQRPLDSSYRGARHDLIRALTRVESSDKKFIEYSLDTKRARGELRAQHTQDKLLQEFISTASKRCVPDFGIGHALFKLVVPVEMEPFLGGTTEVQIELDDGTACIPWELLDTTSGSQEKSNNRPWSIRVKLIRRLLTADFRPEALDSTPASDALVIGEPLCNSENYGPLPGARAEAKAVSDLLKKGLGNKCVLSLVNGEKSSEEMDARNIITTLLSRDWRIIHIAGHGEAPGANGETKGLVLSNGTFLGPREIRNMRQVPELVFINCCHSAALHSSELLTSSALSTYGQAGFAANIAKSLIKIGVRCVVAAGWSVEDKAAKLFATTFYEELLAGKRFIDAAAYAREKTWRECGNLSTTWAAYQCYGDPDWQIQDASMPNEKLDIPPDQKFDGISTASTLLIALESIIVNAKYSDKRLKKQLAKIKYLEEKFGRRWKSIGSVAEAFGTAYGAVGDFTHARSWLERALACQDSSASLKAGEHLAKLYTQEAWQMFSDALFSLHYLPEAALEDLHGEPFSHDSFKKAHEAALTRLNMAKTLLANLCVLLKTAGDGTRIPNDCQDDLALLQVATAKRHSLCAYVFKRIAMVEALAGNAELATRATEDMRAQCALALNLTTKGGPTYVHHAALNFLAAEINLRGDAIANWETFAPDIRHLIRRNTQPRGHTYRDFRSQMAEIELSVYESIVRKELTPRLDCLLNRLKSFWQAEHSSHGESTGRWQSVRDNFWFVLSKYDERATIDERRASAALMHELDRWAELPPLQTPQIRHEPVLDFHVT